MKKMLLASRLLACAWLFAVLLLTLGFRHIGETHPATAALLFLPPGCWLLPIAGLSLVALVQRDAVMALFIGIAGAITAFSIFGCEVRLGSPPTPPASAIILSLITHNTGQAGNASLLPFKNRHQPDLLLLQNAPSRASHYLATKGWEEFAHAEDIGEFTLLSKYRIVSKVLVQRPPTDIPGMKATPIAARFEVVVKGQRIVIYNVHAFSPRAYLVGGGITGSLFYGLAGVPGTRWAETKARLQSFWSAQLAGAQLISDRVAEETLPCIVAGDVNAPPQGVIHRVLTHHLQDAHEKSGSGCGFTFPGITRNPLSLRGPWLRLDYVFANRQWHCLSTEVEPVNPSQHRALAVTLALAPAS